VKNIIEEMKRKTKDEEAMGKNPKDAKEMEMGNKVMSRSK